MVSIIHRLEYGIAFLFILFIYIQQDFPIWLFILLFFVPDATLIGYAINHQVGAILYNIGHHLVVPLGLLWIALVFDLEKLLLCSYVWLAHIFIDRFLGYGLKYKHSFEETHMQKI